jgi:DNA polymerase-1
MPDDSHEHELFGEGLLGGSLAPKRTGNLAERFLIPPFTVFSARDGAWQNRKRAWISLGIKSELGRGGDLTVPISDEGMISAPKTVGFDQPPPPISPTRLAAIVDIEDSVIDISDISEAGPEFFEKARHVAPTFLSPPPPVVIAPRPVQVVRAEVKMPVSDWHPPTEFPQLVGRKIGAIAYDVETTGLDPRKDRIIGFSIAIDEDGPRLYVPFGHEGGDNVHEEAAKRWLMDEVAPLRCAMVGAYLLFDLEMSAAWGVEFKNTTAFHDIQVAEPLIDEWLDSYSLDAIAMRRLGRGKDETLLRAASARYGWISNEDVKKNLHKLPARYVGPYAEADADRPMAVWAVQRKLIEEQELSTIYEVERKQIPILLAMRRRGVPFDVRRAEVLHGKLTAERDRRLAELKRLAGPTAELRAPASLAPAFRERGLAPPRTAATERFPDGQDSITEDWLAAHKGDALVNAVLTGRRVDTLATYVEQSLLAKTINGRLYPTFNQLRRDKEGGGKQGSIARYSCTEPNLQAVAKREKPADELIDFDEELSNSVRCLFPAEEGERYQRNDMSQAEFRLTVDIATGPGAEEARARWRAEPTLSFHKMCGEFAGIDPNDKRRYDQIKALNLAKSYGAQERKIAYILGCSLDDAKTFVRRYEEKLPFTVETFNAAKAAAEKQGFIRTILKRRQRFPLWEPRGNRGDRWVPPLPYDRALREYGPGVVRAGTYMALNRYDQASCADLLKKGLVDLWEAGIFDILGAPLLLVHDELDNSIPQTAAGLQAAAEVPRIMGTCVPMRVPLLIDSSMGPTWGDCG